MKWILFIYITAVGASDAQVSYRVYDTQKQCIGVGEEFATIVRDEQPTMQMTYECKLLRVERGKGNETG
jgi:hypothetical protein